jgi:DNA invertase Pin-like site-specific DNA recombinase
MGTRSKSVNFNSVHKGVAMREKRAGIYTRVSTTDQHPEMQERELVDYAKLRNWAVYKIYSDKGVSGATERRPALDALLDDCRRRKIDVVVVWKFDRFARSLKQLLNALELFRKLGISFVSCTEAIDTSLPHGEMLFQIIGAIAQWERSLIVERVRAGLQHARTQGKRLGRPPLRVLKPKDVAELRKERIRTNAPFRTLATKYGISVWSAHRLCGRHRRSAT